ncbi:MAG: EAL domain-containing protein [Clostridiaceae bacterium]|nr:EAL domain-containing protein [Clostridiaceae bacterium]
MTQITRQNIFDALAHDRFQLFGQPKWTFGKNTCNTYEVFIDLMIAENNERVPSQAFIPIIEADEELTMKFGSWFLEKAFASGAKLMDQLQMDLNISINILGFQANRPEFVDKVAAMLKKTGLDSHRVQFELSEAQPLNETGIANLIRLKDEFGIRLVLGNFGTGYSNVDLLRRIPFDMLELSRDFTARITEFERELKITVAVLQMAQVLDITVCAKGIETAEQMELLEEAGFYKGQGYLIGRPMPMDELEIFVRKYAA